MSRFLLVKKGIDWPVEAAFEGGGWEHGRIKEEAVGRLLVTHPELFGMPNGDRAYMAEELPDGSTATKMAVAKAVEHAEWAEDSDEHTDCLSRIGGLVLANLDEFGLSHVHDQTVSSVLAWNVKTCGHPDCVVRSVMEA